MQQIVISFNYQNENAGKMLVLVLVLVKLKQHWLKPLINSYHAPYKAKHCYWPGLLLVLRFVLLLVFAFNDQQYPSINLLAILVGTGMVIVWAWVSHGVYKNWCLDALEG